MVSEKLQFGKSVRKMQLKEFEYLVLSTVFKCEAKEGDVLRDQSFNKSKPVILKRKVSI